MLGVASGRCIDRCWGHARKVCGEAPLSPAAQVLDQEAALREMPTDSAKVLEWWEQADLERRREVVMSLIEGVPIGPKKPGANTLDPDRVGEPIWRL